MRALSRYAWQVTVPGAAQAAKVRTATTPTTGTTTPAGQTAITTGKLEAVNKTGATLDADSGRPIAALVAAALGVTVTELLSDPGITGARAVAESLAPSTRNEMDLRRALWTSTFRALITYVIQVAVRSGKLRGLTVRDGNRERVVLAADTEPTVDIEWPEWDDVPMDTQMKAIQAADQLNKLPPEVIVRLALQALRVANPDEIIEGMRDPETGEITDPEVSAAAAAVAAHNRGDDPAAVFAGADASD
jgi:hypothetical protein